jgi:xanthine/CO dehydrogenase XdhC/CoxF family maturation factor
VSSLWEQRAARNEALFREVNQNIARLEEQHGSALGEPVFICECPSDACTEPLVVDVGVYQRVRAQPRLFLVLPGHEDPQLARIVERHGDYLIVEKTGVAGEVAERMQP